MISASCAISCDSVGRSFSALARTLRRMGDSGSESADEIAAVGMLMNSARAHHAQSLRQVMEDSFIHSFTFSSCEILNSEMNEEWNQRSHRYPTRNGMTVNTPS